MDIRLVQTSVQYSILALTTALLLGCGGGGSDNSTNHENTATTENTVSTTTDSSTTNTFFSNNNTSVVAKWVTLDLDTAYQSKPNPDTCSTGELSETTKQFVLNKVNEIRKLHGLTPVTYDYQHDDQAMQAALLMAVNGKLDHFPDSSWRCYNQTAYDGASTGNLFLRKLPPITALTPEYEITHWLTEKCSSNLGHRLWLLNPFLTQISYGAVYSDENPSLYHLASVLKVIYSPFNQATTTATGSIISYPQGNYPAKYFRKDSALSFSILIDPNNFYNNRNIDYSHANVTVTNRNTGAAETISNILYSSPSDSGMRGINYYQFNLPNFAYDVTYDVQIDNVKVNNINKKYSYSFKVDSSQRAETQDESITCAGE